MPKASSAAPVRTLSVPPAKTPRVSATADAAPVAREPAMTVVTLRVLGVGRGVGRLWRDGGVEVVLIVVSLSQWGRELL